MNSPNWQHFYRNTKKTHGQCKYCALIIRTPAGNTQALSSHLRNVHQLDVRNSENTIPFMPNPVEIPQIDFAQFQFQDVSHMKSVVWKYFLRAKIGPNVCAKCNICSNIMNIKDKSTTNLRLHLKNKHGCNLDQ